MIYKLASSFKLVNSNFDLFAENPVDSIVLTKIKDHIKPDKTLHITNDQRYPDGSFKRLSGYVGGK